MRSTAVEFFASGDTNTSITAHISAHPSSPSDPYYPSLSHSTHSRPFLITVNAPQPCFSGRGTKGNISKTLNHELYLPFSINGALYM